MPLCLGFGAYAGHDNGQSRFPTEDSFQFFPGKETKCKTIIKINIISIKTNLLNSTVVIIHSNHPVTTKMGLVLLF